MASIPIRYLRSQQLLNVIRIGYCAWELPDPPKNWGSFDRAFHEIWVPSEFCKDSLAKICVRPVRVVRHVVVKRPSANRDEVRASLGLRPEDFVVLAMADLRSSLARKNPAAAIEVFRQALGHRSDCVLLLKLTGGQHDRAARLEIDGALNGLRARVIEAHLSEYEKWGLYAASDLLLSLHRAEGFGLPLAEAMAAGRAVIATGWSGNTDFMNSQNSALVAYDLIATQDPQGLYKDSLWAEPKLDHAIELLRQMYEHPIRRGALAERASFDLRPERQLEILKSQLPSSFY